MYSFRVIIWNLCGISWETEVVSKLLVKSVPMEISKRTDLVTFKNLEYITLQNYNIVNGFQERGLEKVKLRGKMLTRRMKQLPGRVRKNVWREKVGVENYNFSGSEGLNIEVGIVGVSQGVGKVLQIIRVRIVPEEKRFGRGQ